MAGRRPRRSEGARRLRWLPAALIAALAALSAASAQGATAAVPYTVQVAALSDPEAAIELSGALLRDGFPAYVVRAEGAAGAVFRVRVAAFGDRVSADRYAGALGERRGGAPRPALAEAIPAGILPLAPTRLFRAEIDARAVVLPWGEDGLALRSGPEEGLADYRTLDGSAFRAWWAAPRSDGGREEVARLALDDPGSAEDEPSVREALFRQRLRLVADQANVDPERLEQLAVRGEPGDRHLVVWREVGDGVRGVVRADAAPASRAPDAWLGGTPPAPPAPLLVLQPGAAEDGSAAPTPDEAGGAGPAGDAAEGDAAAEDGVDDGVAGGGWTARADGSWTLLEVDGVRWRALVGAPRDGLDDLLVVSVDGATELVRLTPR